MAEKLRIELPLLLPEVADVADGCVQRLVATVSALDGVETAHVVEAAAAPAVLCVHYDRAQLSLARIRDLVTAAGARITGEIGHRLWQVGGEMHPRRARVLERRLAQLPGVLDVGVSASGILRLEYDRAAIGDAELQAALLARGAAPLQPLGTPDAGTDHPPHGHDHADDHAHDHAHAHDHHHGGHGWIDELPFAIAAGLCLAAGFAMARLLPGAPAWLPLAAYVLAYFFGGFFTAQEVVAGLRVRRFEIDTLMLVAAAGAASLGAWAEGALLLFLFSLGHSLEHGALRRAQSAIAALAQLVPATATVRRNGGVETIATAALRPGDVLIVRPHQRVAADGFVLKGHSSVDQSALTGESMPADKMPVADAGRARAAPQTVAAHARLFAGSFNGAGLLEAEVVRAAGESTLARVVQLINEAETQRSGSERFSARIERIFVPAVLALAGLLMFAWVVVDEPFAASFYRAMAVLVAASPCALAISTPSAILSGVARAAQGGVLVKGGGPLERLARARLFAFDKTGTLTSGEPRLRALVAAAGVAEAELLQLAVAVEELSDHPLARAIVRDGRARLAQLPPLPPLPPLQELTNQAGHGLQAMVDGHRLWVGRVEAGAGMPASDWAQAQAAAMRARGETVVAVRRDGAELGLIGLQDRARGDAAQAIRELRALAAAQVVMLSGDSQAVADAVAADLGLDAAYGDLLPADKLHRVQALRRDGAVAMIGDGVNDAPALAAASVGIAMGAAGSDIALETADIALLGDRLMALPFAVALSRRVQTTIRQNIGISLGVVLVLVPATIFGLRIGPAVIAHEGSTLLVVLNALRLLSVPLPARRPETAADTAA